jgi:radical SAM-linked protein
VGIIDLAKRALTTGRAAAEKRRFNVAISISPHVPKPQTPFQWEAQDASVLIEEKIRLLRSKVKGTGLVLKWRDSETSFLEGVFSRGDRRLGAAILEAMRRGCRFDGWTEHLRYEEWIGIFEELGIDPQKYLSRRRTDVRQCWEHVRSPVSRHFLLKEMEKARRAEVSVDCRLAFCHACGIDNCPDRLSPTGRPPGRSQVTVLTEPAAQLNGNHRRELLTSKGASLALATRFRLRFIKEAAVRFISHLELMRVWERTLRRSRLPLAFTEGFRPHLKMSFGPPLPVGYTSRTEYFDLEFARPPAVELLETLNPLLPEGVRLTAWRPILFKTESLMSAINKAAYDVEITDSYLADSGVDPATLDYRLTEAVTRLLDQREILVRRKSKSGAKEVDIRPSIEAIEVSPSNRRLDFQIRFTPRAQARPEEILSRILPQADARLAGVERTGLWVTADDQCLDPFESLIAVAAPNREGLRALG